MRSSACKPVVALILAGGLFPLASFEQKRTTPAPAPARVAAPPAVRPNAPAPAPPRPVPGPVANPITSIDRWNAMTAQQRQRLLSKMPPERQKQFLEKVQKFNSLPKKEQQRSREMYERLSKLPPEQQQVVLRDIRRLDNLPPARKQALNEEIAKLRKMPDAQRSDYLASDEFRNKYYPAEQQMVGNLTKLLPPRK